MGSVSNEPGGNGSSEQNPGIGSRKPGTTTMTCSMCGQPFDRTISKSLPFCSPRCKQLDLGYWLNESYGFPIESGEDYGEDDPDESG